MYQRSKLDLCKRSDRNRSRTAFYLQGILIASLGAVMDVAMSISSTIEEISYQNPELGIKGLFFSGMRVGKDMMGTMSNTLILAFAGGSINTLVFIYAYNYEYLQMINMFDIGIEIIQGVASSMGVILTVPICSFLSACIQGNKRNLDKRKIVIYYEP